MALSVLIVDDDRELRALYRTVLERAGHLVDEAANGAEALRYLMTRTPDVIVMDMLMPMLGGEAVMKRIRQMPALNDVRIVVLTAYPRFRDSALYLQADAFLVKPVRPQQIVQAVEGTLDTASAPPDED
jgi:CheY-like chemotaxis protein